MTLRNAESHSESVIIPFQSGKVSGSLLVWLLCPSLANFYFQPRNRRFLAQKLGRGKGTWFDFENMVGFHGIRFQFTCVLERETALHLR